MRGSRFPTLEKYDVLEELGHGGMATVYRARDLRLGRDVAIKVIHPHLRDSAEAVRRFSIEALAVAKLRHTNIVEVYDVSAPTETEQYLVVELLRGVTLRRLLETHGPLPAEIAASIGVELLAALGHAHDEGVVHRDVKPENVIIEHRPPFAKPSVGADSTPPTPPVASPAPSGVAPVPSASAMAAASRPSDTPGDRVRIKLTDFGIAKLLDGQGVTSTGQVLGSPAHMAPEQIEGREVDGRADVFGMGVLLYESMVGHLPFMGQNPAQVLRRVLQGEYASAEHERPTVGRTWSRILDHALAGAVEARFADTSQMRDALMRELTRLGVTSPRAEIEAWLDDPAGFSATHQAAMTKRLCAHGDEASRRRDVLGAAADYNRALAYAPNDAALMKLVSRMNRRSARQDALRRAAPYAALVLLLAGAGAAGQVWRARAARAHAIAAETPVSVPLLVPVASPIVATPMALPEPVASGRTIAHPTTIAAHPKVPREVGLTDIKPDYGVRLSIDGAPSTLIDGQKSIPLDERPHALTFSCEKDLCERQTRSIPAGDRSIPVSVHMTVKPCRLSIRAVPGNNYVLNDSTHPLLANEVNKIPMSSGSEHAVVKEVDTGRTVSVELRAGKEASPSPVDFTAP